ncbi:MAG TPA: carboxylesterase family protein [Sporichthya sp.]|nr:carboxylesterase family protein [Sporichthya sp.]
MPSAAVVRTSRGKVRGIPTAHGQAFLGIPYAAPPLGQDRFRRPRPADPWDGVREAGSFGPAAPQPIRQLPGIDSAGILGSGWSGSAPELTLNIWTPDPALRGLPVMVFAHGGAFVAGSPSAPIYHGDAFARDGVVLVSIVYRLGLEGFLSVPGGDANPGMRDQLAALAWVQDEIAVFGGDPDNVTAFGQSAGAITLGLLASSKVFNGLTQRVISQSGGLALTHSRDQGARIAAAVADRLGIPPTLEAFAELPIGDVIAVQAAMGPGSVDLGPEPDPALGLVLLLPVRDGEVVPDEPLSGIAASGIDLMVGDTTEEGNLYVAGDPAGDLAAAQPLTEHIFRAPTAALAEAHGAGPARTFRYEFAWRSSALGGRLGACHGVELPFVFDTVDAPGLTAEIGLLGPRPVPRELVSRTHGAWVDFATTGNPGWAEYPYRETLA